MPQKLACMQVLLSDTFEQLKPGLSSFADDPAAAAKSLEPLLAVAVKTVPKDMQVGCAQVSYALDQGCRDVTVHTSNICTVPVDELVEMCTHSFVNTLECP